MYKITTHYPLLTYILSSKLSKSVAVSTWCKFFIGHSFVL